MGSYYNDRMLRALLLVSVIVSVFGCRLPDEAPDDLSELLTFSFSHYDPDDWANDVSLADAAVNLESWFSSDVETQDDFTFDLGFEARLTALSQRLTDEDIAHLDPAPAVVDGQAAAGVLVALETRCSIEDVVDVYLSPNQMDFFPDNYLEYDRTNLEGIECFDEGSCIEARWLTHVTQDQSFPAATWQASFWNATRRLQATAPGGEEVRGLMTQVWMEQPANIEPAGLGSLIQNYQLEFMIERPSGGSLHVYPQWVDFDLGDINTEAAVFLNAYIDGIRDYLRTLESHCSVE